MVCDCCLREKSEARPRALGPQGAVGNQPYDPSNSVPSKVFIICGDCIAEMRKQGSRANVWLSEKLKSD